MSDAASAILSSCLGRWWTTLWLRKTSKQARPNSWHTRGFLWSRTFFPASQINFEATSWLVFANNVYGGFVLQCPCFSSSGILICRITVLKIFPLLVTSIFVRSQINSPILNSSVIASFATTMSHGVWNPYGSPLRSDALFMAKTWQSSQG